MKSSWDETQEKSAYHFDTARHDARWDTVVGLGHIAPNWLDDLPLILERAQPATWETRGYKNQETAVPRSDLAAEEYDLERAGADPKMVITHLDWELPDSLTQVSDLFGLADAMNRIHVQYPGELWNLHIDKLQKWSEETPDDVMRIMIQLTDWQPGQFWEYGNYHWNGWRAGDVTTFDWPNVPHSTANAGHHPRVTLQITGVKTEQTIKFLSQLKKVTSWQV
jgi:hypothetical protein